MQPEDLRYNGENLKDWADLVAEYEVKNAQSDITRGRNINAVLETLANRITSKMLHPVLIAVKEQYISNTDIEIDRQSYNEKFLKNRQLVPDHVVDDY